MLSVKAGANSGVRIAGKVLATAVYLTTILLAYYVTRIYFFYPQTDDAYVRANTVGIAARVSGPIVTLPIRDNQRVKRGDLLFVIDPRPYQAELDSASASVDLTDLQIDALDNSIAAARARETQLEADRAYDQQYLERLIPLLPENFVTPMRSRAPAVSWQPLRPQSRTPTARSRAPPMDSASTAISTRAGKPSRQRLTRPGSTSSIATSARRSTVT